MKKRFLTLALAFSFALALIPAVIPVKAETFTPVTGWEMMEKLGMGINIGNTLEALPYADGWGDRSHMESETAWGAAKIEQWQFKAIKQKGFDNVRIPISWTPHMDKDGKIDKAWMDRVQQCVDWALAEGLYVTINTHHENEGYYKFMGTNEDYAEAKNWLTNVWGQIADRFKDYSERLLFEPMNEPRPDGDGWYWDYVNYPEQAAGMKKLVALTNKLNHDMLDLIRKSGGNNDKRVVMLTMPQGDANLIGQYEPPNDSYTMLGTFFYPDNGKSDQVNADKMLAQIKAALAKKIPLVMKETCPLSITDPAKGLAWGTYAYGELAKLGVPSQWWNCGGTGPDELFDRAMGVWNKPMVEVFFAAYGQTPGADTEPPPPALPYELKGPYEDGGYTFWNPPAMELKAAEKMVVEYEGKFDWGYAFSRNTGAGAWVQFDNGHARITEESGKLVCDIRGVEGAQLGFGAWEPGDAAKIKRVYIDTWDGAPKPETPSGWAAPEVNRAIAAGIVPPSLQSKYADDITRLEFSALAVAIYETYTGQTITEQKTFTDTTDPNAEKAAGVGIVTGATADTFNPGGVFNRQGAARLMVNLLEAMGIDLPKEPAGFADNGSIADWALVQVGQASAAGLMGSVGDSKFNPMGPFTRQQAIILMLNVWDYLQK